MGSEIFTVDGALRDLSSIKILVIYIFLLGKGVLSKMGFFKMEVFRRCYLLKYASVWKLIRRSWKWPLWPTIPMKKNQLGISRNVIIVIICMYWL